MLIFHTKIILNRALGFVLTEGMIFEELPMKVVVTYLIQAAFRLRLIPDPWKEAEVLIIRKQGNLLNDVSSYMPISLLTVIPELSGRLNSKSMEPLFERSQLVSEYHFGFREWLSTILQVHRNTNLVEKTLEEKDL